MKHKLQTLLVAAFGAMLALPASANTATNITFTGQAPVENYTTDAAWSVSTGALADVGTLDQEDVLTFDLDDGQYMTYAATSRTDKAATVEVSGTTFSVAYEPPADLPPGSQASIVLGQWADGATGPTYYGWAGETNATGALVWTQLSSTVVSDPTAAVDVKMVFDYTATPKTVTFKVGETTLGSLNLEDQNRARVEGITFQGSGSISDLAGTYATTMWTFDFKDGDTVVESVQVEDGDAVAEIAAPSKTGHTFDAWQSNGSNYVFSSAVTDDFFVTAKYDPIQYTISWDANGGTLSGEGYTSGAVDYGTTIVSPTAAKAADAQYTYSFEGWTPTPDATVTSNATYTAQFSSTVNSYDVTFSWHGDSSTTSYEYGQTPMVPTVPASYVENGTIYTFQRWNAEIVSVTGAATYNAVYTGTAAKATVLSVTDNGATTNVVGTYASLAEAVGAAPAGAVVQVLADVALTSTVVVDKNLTIDLNGNDIAATDARALWIKSGDVALAGEGTVSANGAGLGETSSVIRVGDSAANTAAAKLTIGKGVTVSSAKSYGVTVFGKNSDGDASTTDIALDVYGTVAVTSTGEADAAIAGNGSSGLSAVDVTIRDGAVVSATNQTGIYFPGAGKLSIEGGSITAPTAVYAKAGTVAVSGGTLTATGAKTDYQYYGNGPKATGDALVLDNCGYPNGTTFAASITGGTFVSANAQSVASYAYGADATTQEAREPLADFIPATVGGQPNPARFSDAKSDGVPAGYALVAVEGSDPTVYAVSASAPIQYYNTWSVPSVYYFEDEDPIPSRTTQASTPSIKRTGESSYHAAEDWVVKTWTITASSASDASTPDDSIATVDANGLVTFSQPGTVKVWLTMTDPSGAVKSAYKTVSYKTAPAWTVSADGETRTAYATLLSAFNAAQDGERVVLGADASVGNIGRMTLNADKAVTLDLNGRTVTLTGSYREDSGVALFTVKQGSLTVVDTAETKGGIVASGTNARAFNVDGTARAAATDAVLTIGEGVNVSSATECCVVIVGKATLNTAGNLSAPADFAIAGNGSAGNGGTVINVTGGTVSGDEVAIYQPQDGTLTISGGTITGDTAVYVKSGSVSVTGGTLTGTGAAADYTFNGNGANATGDALVIDNCGYPGGAPSASITGGTFVSQSGKSVASYAKDETFTPVADFIPAMVDGQPNPARFSDAESDGVPAGYVLTPVEGSSNPVLYEIARAYTIIWVVDNVATTNVVLAGGAVTAPADPTKEFYTFAGWSPAVAATAEADATYVAQWTAKTYTIIWVVEGQTPVTNTVDHGTAPTYSGTPTRAPDQQYTYTFKEWTPEVVAATADATYTATWTQTLNKYTVTWNANGGTLSGDYTTGEVDHGTTLVAPTAAKDPTEQYTYTFAGWSPALDATVTSNATYTASWTENLRTYTITWVDGNGDTLKTDTLAYGATPSYDGATPAKDADSEYSYTFNDTWQPAIVDVTGNATYTAQFDSTPLAPPAIDGVTLALKGDVYLDAVSITNPAVVKFVATTNGAAADVTPTVTASAGAATVSGDTVTFTGLPWNDPVDWTLAYNDATLPGRFYAKAETQWFSAAADSLTPIQGLAEGMKGIQPTTESPTNQMVRIEVTIEIPDGAMDSLPTGTDVGDSRTGFAVAQLTGDAAPAYYGYNGSAWVKLMGAAPAANTEVDLLIVLDTADSKARYYVDGVALSTTNATPVYAIPMKAGDAVIKGIGFANPEGVKSAVVAEYDVPYAAAVGDTPYMVGAEGVAAADKTGTQTLYLLADEIDATIELALGETVKVDTSKGSFKAESPVSVAASAPAGAELVTTVDGNVTTYTVAMQTFDITFADYNGSPLHSTNVVYGATGYGPATDPSREDYVFLGWTNAVAGGAVVATAALPAAAADAAYTAVYEANTPPVVVEAVNPGSGLLPTDVGVKPIEVTDAGFVVHFRGTAGVTYGLLATTDLTLTEEQWKALTPVATVDCTAQNEGEVLTLVAPIGENDTVKFFKIGASATPAAGN